MYEPKTTSSAIAVTALTTTLAACGGSSSSEPVTLTEPTNTTVDTDLGNGEIVVAPTGDIEIIASQTGNGLNIVATEGDVSGSNFAGNDLAITTESAESTIQVGTVEGDNADLSSGRGLFVINANGDKGNYTVEVNGDDAGDALGVFGEVKGLGNSFSASNVAHFNNTGVNSTITAAAASATNVDAGTTYNNVTTLTVGGASETGSINCSAGVQNDFTDSATKSTLVFAQTEYPLPTNGQRHTFGSVGVPCVN